MANNINIVAIDNNCTTSCVTSLNYNKNTHNHSDFGAKLRRLKIEESILKENLKRIYIARSKTDGDCDFGEVNPLHGLTYSEFRKFTFEINKSYNELQQLFQDIKACTSSKDVIVSIDIDDLKKNTLDLENKIKSLKLYLHKELIDLKNTEKDLNVKLNDPAYKSNLNIKPTTQTVKFMELVSSPVKATMNSPFKYSEVQAFQEFMSLSKNRYGGWAEYYHNIFVHIWQKYLNTEYSLLSDEVTSTIINSQEFQSFTCELLPKLQGVSVDEIISHARWYLSYLHLKNRQQEAINKWRSIRRFMKPNMGNNVEMIPSSKNRLIKTKKRSNNTGMKNTDNVNRSDKIESKNKTGRVPLWRAHL